MAACTSGAPQAAGTPSPVRLPSPPLTPSAAPAAGRVFVIVMENHSRDEALSGTFTASLAARYGEATNYHGLTHPSIPNYLGLVSGSTWGVTDDSYHALPPADLGHELSAWHVGWRAYMEGLGPAGCLNSPRPYDAGHNPFAFFGAGCPPEVVPATGLSAELAAGAVPAFVWITPDVCHDQHSCPISTGDDWLRGTVGQILASPAFSERSALFITWDEDDHSAYNNVLTLAVTAAGGHRASGRYYDHYSLLATVCDLLGVPRLGQAAGATPLTDLLPPGFD